MEREEAEWVVQRHGQTVYRLAYARTGNREDAEDVTQETFLRLVRAAPKFLGRGPLPGMAAAGGGQLCPGPVPRPVEEAGAAHRGGGARPCPRPGPGAGRGAGGGAVPSGELPAAGSTCFTHEGLSIWEIAGVLGKREGAVRTSLTRARALLRDKLKEEGDYV